MRWLPAVGLPCCAKQESNCRRCEQAGRKCARPSMDDSTVLPCVRFDLNPDSAPSVCTAAEDGGFGISSSANRPGAICSRRHRYWLLAASSLQAQLTERLIISRKRSPATPFAKKNGGGAKLKLGFRTEDMIFSTGPCFAHHCIPIHKTCMIVPCYMMASHHSEHLSVQTRCSLSRDPPDSGRVRSAPDVLARGCNRGTGLVQCFIRFYGGHSLSQLHFVL